jgi:hypothetical protein
MGWRIDVMRKPRVVPEFELRTARPRAGFVPSEKMDEEVELWMLWCRGDAAEQEERRATTRDIGAAGYMKKKKKRKKGYY